MPGASLFLPSNCVEVNGLAGSTLLREQVDLSDHKEPVMGVKGVSKPVMVNGCILNEEHIQT